MRVALDVDGVIADFVGAVIGAVNARFDIDISRDDIDTYNIHMAKPIREHGLGGFLSGLFKTSEFAESIQPFTDGDYRAVLKDLHGWHEVYYVTAPMLGSPTWHKHRVNLLRSLGAPEDRIVFLRQKYLFQADVLVDDCPKNVSDFLAFNQSSRAVLVGHSYNVGAEPNSPRCVRSAGPLDALKNLIG